MQILMAGLGKMGLNMARRLKAGGHEVAGYDRSDEKVSEAAGYGIKGAGSLKALVDSFPGPRIVWLMLPAGKPVDDTITELRRYLKKGDTVIDGGNSFYKDGIRRSRELDAAGIEYMDAGVSGGVWGLENGYCLMAGGKKEVFEKIEPALKALAPPQGYMYCGPAGAGHFVKMAHNAVEYGMMEAYAEGFELLNASPYGKDLDLANLSRLWNRGSVVRSWLLELLEGAFRSDKGLESIRGYVEDSGEGRWAVKEAVDLGVEMPAITESLFRRFRSRQEDPFAEKLLAALRKEFGGHAVKPGGK